MRPRSVYFLWLLHAHSIILYSFLHLIPRISPTPSLVFTPPISRAYAILHSAHASLTPPHTPTIPLTRHHFLLLLLFLLFPFLPVWNPNSWRLVAEGTVPRLSHREIHSRAQLMPSESKSYFVHSHSNFQRVSFTISLLLSVFLYLFIFLFLSLRLLSSSLSTVLKEITNEYVMRPRLATATEISPVVFPVLRFIGSVFYFFIAAKTFRASRASREMRNYDWNKDSMPKSKSLIWM